MLVELGVNTLRLNCLLKALVVIISMDLHPIRPVEFNQALITGQIGWKFTEIDAGQIGCKYIEITLPVKGFGGHNLNGFTPNSTGRILSPPPVEFNQA